LIANVVTRIVLLAPEISVKLIMIQDNTVIQVINSLFRNFVVAMGNHGVGAFHQIDFDLLSPVYVVIGIEQIS